MTSVTPFWCFYFYLGTYFTPFSSVSTVDFEQLNVTWECTAAQLPSSSRLTLGRLSKYFDDTAFWCRWLQIILVQMVIADPR